MSTTPSTQSPPATPSKPQSAAEKMAAMRRHKRQEYYQDKTPEEAKNKALDYQMKRVIQNELQNEHRKFEIDTELATQNLTAQQKKEDAEYVHRLKLQVALDKKERENEEKERLEQVLRIKNNKQTAQREAEKVRLERIAAFQESGGARPTTKKEFQPDL